MVLIAVWKCCHFLNNLLIKRKSCKNTLSLIVVALLGRAHPKIKIKIKIKTFPDNWRRLFKLPYLIWRQVFNKKSKNTFHWENHQNKDLLVHLLAEHTPKPATKIVPTIQLTWSSLKRRSKTILKLPYTILLKREFQWKSNRILNRGNTPKMS